MVLEVLKSIKLGNTHRNVYDRAERAVSTKWQSITGSPSWGELSFDGPEGSMGGLQWVAV